MSVRQGDYAAKAARVRDWLVAFFEEHPLFQDVTLHAYTEDASRGGIGIKLYLNDDTYANCYFMYEEDEDEEEEKEKGEKRTATITMVESDIGKATGFFLFHLQLVIAVVAGANEITLDNDTGDVERARRGIYQLFKVNDRGMDDDDRARMTAANWAQKPEMVHFVNRTSLARIQRVLLGRVRATLKEGDATEVWRPDAVETLTLLFRKLKQRFDLFQGGGYRRITGKKTRKSKKSNKSRRIRFH
jgi:hypothetical protein